MYVHYVISEQYTVNLHGRYENNEHGIATFFASLFVGFDWLRIASAVCHELSSFVN